MQKRPSYHFLHFTKKEKNGTIVILVVIGLLTALPFIYPFFNQERNVDENTFKKELAALQTKPFDSTNNHYEKMQWQQPSPATDISDNNTSVHLFYFDPNTLSADGWKKLGLKERTIATIQNYLSKGGKFREPADIKKIWGIRDAKAAQLLPYVRMEQPPAAQRQEYKPTEKKEWVSKTIAAIDINHADSAAYISLPGIGPAFAKRILKFRDKLGGFYTTEQVSETFGLPDSTFQKIKEYLFVSDDQLRKININAATLDELKQHPYIRYTLANAIVQFRLQHGNFQSIDEIKKIMLVDDELYRKVSPYLTVQ